MLQRCLPKLVCWPANPVSCSLIIPLCTWRDSSQIQYWQNNIHQDSLRLCFNNQPWFGWNKSLLHRVRCDNILVYKPFSPAADARLSLSLSLSRSLSPLMLHLCLVLARGVFTFQLVLVRAAVNHLCTVSPVIQLASVASAAVFSPSVMSSHFPWDAAELSGAGPYFLRWL